jgi:hypothetical protein
MSVGIEAAHLKWFTRRPERGRERSLPLLVVLRRAFDLGALAISTVTRCSCPATSEAAGNGRPASCASAVHPSWGKRASLWSVRSLRRGTARRCSAGHIVCSGERSESNGADYRPPPGGLAPSRDAVSRCDEDIGRITVASFGVTPTAGHTGRDPFFNLGLQPTHRVRGELATGRKLPSTLQTPERRPRKSRARADLSTSEEARW